MIGEKHDLIHDMPEHRETIHDLKVSNEHFRHLFDEYHEIEHEVRRIDEGVETPSDDYASMQKRKLLSLKDQLFQMIREAEKQDN